MLVLTSIVFFWLKSGRDFFLIITEKTKHIESYQQSSDIIEKISKTRTSSLQKNRNEMKSRDKIVSVDGVKYLLHLSLELGEDIWHVRIHYRRSTHEAFRQCTKENELYKEFASFITHEWVDRVYRDYFAACLNTKTFEY